MIHIVAWENFIVKDNIELLFEVFNKQKSFVLKLKIGFEVELRKFSN